jgi:hypothetical protein
MSKRQQPRLHLVREMEAILDQVAEQISKSGTLSMDLMNKFFDLRSEANGEEPTLKRVWVVDAAKGK